MRQYITRRGIGKSLFLLGAAVVVTMLIAPDLNLVPVRYKEGDIIPQDIVISDNINLEDVRSTDARRQEALADLPEVFDYEPRQRARTVAAVHSAYEQLRGGLDTIARKHAEARSTLQENSRQRILAMIERQDALALQSRLAYAKRLLVAEIGRLSEDGASAGQSERLQKLRFDLLAVDGQVAVVQQNLALLDGRMAQLKETGTSLVQAGERLAEEETQTLAGMKAEFEKTLGITVDDSTFRILKEAQFSPDLERMVINLLDPLLNQLIVATRESLPAGQKGIQLQNLETKKLERFDNLTSIAQLEDVRRELNRRGQELDLREGRGVSGAAEAVIAVAQRLVRPNLTANKGDTERLRSELRNAVSPVYFSMKKGDVVARAGDIATAQQVEVIRALNAYNLSNPKYPQIVGTFLIVVLALFLGYQLIVLRETRGPRGTRRRLLLALLLVIPLVLAQLVLWIVPPLTTVYDFIPASSFNYLIPAALTSMLAGILLGFEVAIFTGFAASLFLAILLGNSLSVFIYAMMGSIVAAMPMRNFETRSAIWEHGARVSAINVPVILVLHLLEQSPVGWHIAVDMGAGLVNGLGVALLTSTILPLMEKLFDITTNLRLLELSNMNHPALKELAVRAPGTYHHSIVVGNLSESVAGGIRANALLVRVASLYHDIGKMLCPLYFVENQHQRNYHDDLPAKTSARIIINHVKDGLELARRYKLGQAINDILAQHHGDSLVRYFFHKAQEEEEADASQPMEEEDFHYPGPKPQTKEAGLVMLADVTEAAIRSLDDPSAEDIREMVQKLASRVYKEGQLDESGLTFNDLNYIEKSFTRLLLSIHHHRISYPELKVMGQGKFDSHHDETAAASDAVDDRRASS